MAGTDLVVCIPVFNDWASAGMLLRQLDEAAADWDGTASVLLVDDGSFDEGPAAIAEGSLVNLARVDVLRLRRNVGHQRAICIGLCKIHSDYTFDYVVVMDGDGEDAPRDVAALLAMAREGAGRRTVFAKRLRRTESLGFRAGYLCYRVLHRILTGRGVDIGNFSVIPAAHVERLVGVSELWNHYAAAVIQARIPMDKVPINRGHRLDGRSKMNLTSLVIHGLSAISVYHDRVSVRVLFAIGGLMSMAFAGMLTVLGIRFFTDDAIPGWATFATGLLAVVMLNLLLLAFVIVQFILQSRDKASFLPLRDWSYFVSTYEAAYAPSPAGDREAAATDG